MALFMALSAILFIPHASILSSFLLFVPSRDPESNATTTSRILPSDREMCESFEKRSPIEFYYDFSVVQDSTKLLSPNKLQLRGEYPRDGRATENERNWKKRKRAK